jgi:adenosylcobinamide-GDP ribazoletransferase
MADPTDLNPGGAKPRDANAGGANPDGAYDPGDLWTDLMIGLIFYTRLPITFQGEIGANAMARATRLNPLVGAIVGLVGAIAYGLALALGVTPFIAGLIALGATILFTGALHEDGLADMVDGFGGGADLEGKLAIMSESRIGTFGALALILSVSVRAACLGAIDNIDFAAVASALILSHAAGRAIIPALMAHLPLARPSGLAARVGVPPASSVTWSLLGAVVIAILGVGPVVGGAALVAGAVAALLVSLLALRQIGGITGDVLGAAEQAVEITVLLAIATFAGSARAVLAGHGG